jgi:GntR family transcriptional regulator, transcriptional repressor for pyruvate dehydrogenase complex
MAAEKLARTTLIDALVGRLEEQIVSGEYPAGARLPGEEALAAQFGISRPVVREGLSRLRERGFLETLNGRGTFVRLPNVDDLTTTLVRHIRLGPQDTYSVAQLYEARTAIEATTARLAATRADEHDLAEMEEQLTHMRAGRHDPAAYTAADLGFHVAVANAARNPFLGMLLGPLATVIVQGIFRSSHASQDATASGIRGHGRILRHIENHDPAGAAREMTRHLAESQKLFPVEILSRLGGDETG